MKELKDKNKLWISLKKICFFGFKVLMGFLIGYLASTILPKTPILNYLDKGLSSADVPIIISFLFIVIGLFINVNVHEFGHFIFGKLSGYKLMSYRFSIFSWENQNAKMNFSIRKDKGYSGLCKMIPSEKELAKYKDLLFYSGGIILNLIVFIIFLFLSFWFFDYAEIFSHFFLIVAILGLFFGVANLIPFFSEGSPSDGKIIWSLILKRPLAEKLIEFNKISAQLSAGIRPRNLDISLSIDLENIKEFDMNIIIFLYFKALDDNNIKKMNKYIDLIEKNIDVALSWSLEAFYYEICYNACINKEKEKAEKYYKKSGKILQKDKDANGLRIKAYYEYYINNNGKKAIKYCDNALTVIDKFPLKGQALMEKDLVNKLKKSI